MRINAFLKYKMLGYIIEPSIFITNNILNIILAFNFNSWLSSRLRFKLEYNIKKIFFYIFRNFEKF